MSSFTHHNTTINILDVIIETDPEKVEFTSNKVEELKENHKVTCKEFSLDDNVDLVNSAITTSPPALSDGVLKDASRPANVPKTALDHPKNVFFVPVVLDDRQHLPSDLN